MNSYLRSFFPLLLLSTLTLIFGGCASYKLGSGGALPFKSIYVAPATNKTFAAQANAVLSSSVRDAFINDGRLRLVTKEADADAVLTIDIVDYARRRGARSEIDTIEAIDFDLVMTTDISLFDATTGGYFFQNRTIQDRSNAYVDNPYTPAGSINTQSFNQGEYQAMPKLARALGQKIADEVLSTW